MQKLLENEATFLKSLEDSIDSLKEGMKSIDDSKDLDDNTKAYLKDETLELVSSIEQLFKDHRRFYTNLRKSVMFDSFEKKEK
ncbi:MAG: hypothetical protein CBD58_03195 [bacterium TMED198]|nr:MAG: hypothetical protein CBD58_03195 [bacterium TMED198]|tara:strand:- start:290 stop:538 length:249 start_codon:yes stop_codon:yes gene_type:complete